MTTPGRELHLQSRENPVAGMVTRGEAVGALVLSEVEIGGVVVLLSFPTDRVVWIP